MGTRAAVNLDRMALRWEVAGAMHREEMKLSLTSSKLHVCPLTLPWVLRPYMLEDAFWRRVLSASLAYSIPLAPGSPLFTGLPRKQSENTNEFIGGVRRGIGFVERGVGGQSKG